MYLQKKPHPWSCLATSIAMALEIPTWHLHELVGHDGSHILFPDLPEPQCRRGFHINEAVLACLALGYAASPVELAPHIAPSGGGSPPAPVYPEEHAFRQFAEMVQCGRGVIECKTGAGNWHAVAYELGTIYDPDGREFDYSREACEGRGLFTVRLWQIERVK